MEDELCSAQEKSLTGADRQLTSRACWELRLFDAWSLRGESRDIRVRTREQRLVALLALQGARRRSYLAGMLWPESTESRASGSLRAALWQLESVAPGLLVSDRQSVGLHPELSLDVHEVTCYFVHVRGWAAEQRVPPEVATAELERVLSLLMGGELLPGWYDDWVLYERARLQQVRLRMLELLAELLALRGENALAVAAAMTAIGIEPMRESAVRTLIRLHIADGNYHDAVEEAARFRRRLARELGVLPSSQFEALVAPLLTRRPLPVRPLLRQRAPA